MASDSSEVRVAVTGAVSVGPTTTAIPTSANATVTGVTDLGYVGEDGVTETRDRSTSKLKAWQNAAVVREVVTESSFTYKFKLIQTNKAAVELYYGTTVDSLTGAILIVPSATGGRHAFVIDVIDGDDFIRTVHRRGRSDRGRRPSVRVRRAHRLRGHRRRVPVEHAAHLDRPARLGEEVLQLAQVELIDRRAGCSARTPGPPSLHHTIRATHPRNPERHTAMTDNTAPAPAPVLNADPFTYNAKNGDAITVPSFGAAPAGLIRRVRHLEELDQVFTMLEELADADALAAVDRLGLVEFAEFTEAWQEAAGASVPN